MFIMQSNFGDRKSAGLANTFIVVLICFEIIIQIAGSGITMDKEDDGEAALKDIANNEKLKGRIPNSNIGESETPVSKAKKEDGKLSSTTKSKFEVETHPSPESGIPKLLYKANNTLKTNLIRRKHKSHGSGRGHKHRNHRHSFGKGNKHRNHRHLSGKGHKHRNHKTLSRKGHRHHKSQKHLHHKHPPKLEFDSETQITFKIRNTSDTPPEDINEADIRKDSVETSYPNKYISSKDDDTMILGKSDFPGSSENTMILPIDSFETQHYKKLMKKYEDQRLKKAKPLEKEIISTEKADSTSQQGKEAQKQNTIVDSILGRNKYKDKDDGDRPFFVKLTSVKINDGKRNFTGKPSLSIISTGNSGNYGSNKDGSKSKVPLSKSEINLISNSMNKDAMAGKILVDQKGESVFHKQMSPGELLVPQKKYITMEVKTKTVRLPTDSKTKSDDSSINDSDRGTIELRPISINDVIPQSPPSQPRLTIIKSTNLVINMGNQTALSRKPRKRKEHKELRNQSISVHKIETKRPKNISSVLNNYKSAVSSLQPHCSIGADSLKGFGDFYQSINKANGWKESMDVFQKMAFEAAEALGNCFQKMWTDMKSVLARKKRSSQMDIELAAKEFTDNFMENFGQPVARFFREVSNTVMTAFEGKPTLGPTETKLITEMGDEADFITTSIARVARSKELLSALNMTPKIPPK